MLLIDLLSKGADESESEKNGRLQEQDHLRALLNQRESAFENVGVDEVEFVDAEVAYVVIELPQDAYKEAASSIFRSAKLPNSLIEQMGDFFRWKAREGVQEEIFELAPCQLVQTLSELFGFCLLRSMHKALVELAETPRALTLLGLPKEIGNFGR